MTTQSNNLRVWQDSKLNGMWRCSYRDGEDTVVVSFPDLNAMGDFIAEELGLTAIGALARSGDARYRLDISDTELALS